MPREFQQDGELSFGGFASYPNPASLDPQKGLLTAVSNMRILEGVITPRAAMMREVITGISSTVYAASCSTSQGDFIYVWGQDNVLKRYCTTTPSGLVTVPAAARPYRPIRGQGYQNLATIEASSSANWSGEYDFTACTNVLGRLAYAKNDQIWVSLFGGIQPYNGDTISLVQGTYDSVVSLHYSNQFRKLYAFGKRSVYDVSLGFSSMSHESGRPQADFFHKVNLLTGQEGILAKDSVAEVAGQIFYLGHDGVYAIDAQKGMVEGQGPMSDPIANVFEGIPAAQMQKAVGVAWRGRYYLLLPNPVTYQLDTILVINPTLPNMFESIDTYKVPFVSIMTARDASGVPCLWAVGNNSIYKMESNPSENRDLGAGDPFVASFKSRNYNFRTDFDKRFDACTLSLDTKGPAEVEFYANTINPDSRVLLDQLNGNVGQAVRRALAGKKCTGLMLEVVVKSGKPLFYSFTVDGSIAGRSIFNVF
jgi:hypothetical protein